MPLHDAVGINCNKGATTEYQGADVKCMRYRGGMMIIVFVLSDLTWLPVLGGGRKSWYIILLLIVKLYSFMLNKRIAVKI